jgi:hypothetical protein
LEPLSTRQLRFPESQRFPEGAFLRPIHKTSSCLLDVGLSSNQDRLQRILAFLVKPTQYVQGEKKKGETKKRILMFWNRGNSSPPENFLNDLQRLLLNFTCARSHEVIF